MSHENIIRAGKDADFRNNLSEKERALLPKNPAGLFELTDADLSAAAGGAMGQTLQTSCAARIC